MERDLDWSVIVLIGLGAVLANIGLRVPLASVAVSGTLLAALLLVIVTRRPSGHLAWFAILLATGLASLLAIRDSMWVASTASVASAALMGLLAADALAPAQRRPWLRAFVTGVTSSFEVGPSLRHVFATIDRDRTGLGWAHASVAAVSVAVAVVLGAILASGDPVFAAILTSVEVTPEASHLTVSLLMVVPFTILTTIAMTANRSPISSSDGDERWRLESRTAVWSVAAVLVVWCVIQVWVAAGGAEAVLENEGLTAAEYARQGFFQLVAAAAVALAILNGAHRLSRRGVEPDPSQRVPAVVIGASLGILIGATFARLAFYIDKFGLTMLRLAVATFLAWLLIMTVLSVVRALGIRRQTNWLPTAAVASAAGLALLFGAVDPEARVAEFNLHRAEDEGTEVDLAYLLTLSDDVRPVLASYDWERRQNGRPPEITPWLCIPARPTDFGVLGWNRARTITLDVNC